MKQVTDWRDPIHPGEILQDELAAMGMTTFRLAQHLHIPNNRLYQILEGRRGITADTALRLSKFFGTSPELWLNLQQSYDPALFGKLSSGVAHRLQEKHLRRGRHSRRCQFSNDPLRQFW